VDALKENYTTGCGCMKRDPYQRLWMNKKKTIPQVVDE
jgi:hypothetical protein